MPNYTRGIYDTHAVTCKLSGDHGDTKTLHLSAFTQYDGPGGGLNPIHGFEVGSVFTVDAGTQEYNIQTIDYREVASDAVVTAFQAVVVVDVNLAAADRDSNSGQTVHRKYKGAQQSLAEHLRKRQLGYI